MKTLHEELKEIRLTQNTSLKTIAEKTKIRLDFLEKLEEGDYTIAPMPYIRAFLREYAETVGIDPNLVIQKLDNKINSILPGKIQQSSPYENDAEPEPVSIEPPAKPEHLSKDQSVPEDSATATQHKIKKIHTVESAPVNDGTDRVITYQGKPADAEITGQANVQDSPPEPLESAGKRSTIEISEQRSYSTWIFASFILIITVVALIMFFINKG